MRQNAGEGRSVSGRRLLKDVLLKRRAISGRVSEDGGKNKFRAALKSRSLWILPDSAFFSRSLFVILAFAGFFFVFIFASQVVPIGKDLKDSATHLPDTKISRGI